MKFDRPGRNGAFFMLLFWRSFYACHQRILKLYTLYM